MANTAIFKPSHVLLRLHLPLVFGFQTNRGGTGHLNTHYHVLLGRAHQWQLTSRKDIGTIRRHMKGWSPPRLT